MVVEQAQLHELSCCFQHLFFLIRDWNADFRFGERRDIFENVVGILKPILS